MDPTVSVSKGVFVFKNNVNFKNKKTTGRKNVNITGNIFADTLWYKSYVKEWNSVDNAIQALNDKMFSQVLGNLISFVQGSYKKKVDEIQAAVLLTGINMPDHIAQFTSLCKEIKKVVTPHVVTLQSQNCQNIKSFIENMVYAFVNETNEESENDDSDIEKKNTIRKSQCSIALLQSWYEDLYPNRKEFKNLVVIIQDFEGFNEEVLQMFILIASSYINILPFTLIFGVATSLSVLHKSLQYQVSSKINVEVFTSQSSSTYLNNILEYIFFRDSTFHLGGKVFTLFTDIFLFYDLSVTGFIQNIKYAMLEHYSYGNAMALCTNITDTRTIINKFKREDCENVRQLMSFRKLVESRSYEERIKLLLDDDYFKQVLYEEIMKIHDYMRLFHLFIKCLHVLVYDLPKNPLGHQIRELYNVAASKSIATTVEFKECMQLLGFQSRNELVVKFERVLTILEEHLNNNRENEFVEEYFKEISEFLANVCVDSMEEDELSDEAPVEDLQNMNRQQLKQKLFTMSKKSKPLNRYEKIRKNLIDYMSGLFQKHLYEPNRNYFHEIFFFDDISIKNHIVGAHRSAIHTSLNDPNYYLQCSCCKIPNDTIIHKSMPDISIIYKLHLEYGKMINLFDWLQAFLSIIDPIDADEEVDDDNRKIEPELQARFTQAVAEMEFLGFVKSSKRKADHVTRLTWGG